MIKKLLPKKILVKTKAAIKDTEEEKYVFRLFISGMLPNSTHAVININTICDTYLKGRYTLEVIDIYQQPSLAIAEDIIAIPVLIKKSPLPEERLIGDLSNTEMVLKVLHIT